MMPGHPYRHPDGRFSGTRGNDCGSGCPVLLQRQYAHNTGKRIVFPDSHPVVFDYDLLLKISLSYRRNQLFITVYFEFKRKSRGCITPAAGY
jgi:hypothetical protein